MRRPQVHDLVKLSSNAADSIAELAVQSGSPWVETSMKSVPWAVVRRALPTSADNVAIGIRGNVRSERWATEISVNQIEEIVSVHEIQGTMPVGPAFDALKAFDRASFQCGPGGSVGFELHTGWKATHPESDLDMVLYLDGPPSSTDMALIEQAIQKASEHTRVDLLVETPSGGVAFAELARATGLIPQPSFMLRTPTGPELVTEIWRSP